MFPVELFFLNSLFLGQILNRPRNQGHGEGKKKNKMTQKFKKTKIKNSLRVSPSEMMVQLAWQRAPKLNVFLKLPTKNFKVPHVNSNVQPGLRATDLGCVVGVWEASGEYKLGRRLSLFGNLHFRFLKRENLKFQKKRESLYSYLYYRNCVNKTLQQASVGIRLERLLKEMKPKQSFKREQSIILL